MKIGLFPIDSKYPNYALMKISSFHKNNGDTVEFYNGIDRYDIVYASKIFSFTNDWQYPIFADTVIRGGTGYSIEKKLDDSIENSIPDFEIYNIDKNLAYGFLTRGCPNKCSWCVVPKKEGNISEYRDIEEVLQCRKKAILMDNNVLASDFGLNQIEKIVKLKIRVDFNQAMDARLVDEDVAKLLSKVKWTKRIRFGCDTPGQIHDVVRAIELITKNGYNGEFFLYCMLNEDINECYYRVNYWGVYKNVIPYCQPYLDFNSTNRNIPQWQADMARWANRKQIYKSVDFKDYIPRKGFSCENYFKNNKLKK